MAQGIREFFDSKAGRALALLLCVAGIAAIVMVLKRSTGDSEVAAQSRNRLFVCAETLKPFTHELQIGESIPVLSPHSGKQTGYPAELCYWTKDGKVRDKPVPVLLNTYLNKPEPTFCPDCGRLVTPHNPAPVPDQSPPPTKDQYVPTTEPSRDR
jgi:hypothetical protein